MVRTVFFLNSAKFVLCTSFVGLAVVARFNCVSIAFQLWFRGVDRGVAFGLLFFGVKVTVAHGLRPSSTNKSIEMLGLLVNWCRAPVQRVLYINLPTSLWFEMGVCSISHFCNLTSHAWELHLCFSCLERTLSCSSRVTTQSVCWWAMFADKLFSCSSLRFVSAETVVLQCFTLE
jgi:hypothetical protein